MNDRQIRTLRSFDTILAYWRERAALLGPEAPAIMKHLDAAYAELFQLRTLQRLNQPGIQARSLRSQVEKMRTDHMLPLARLGKRVFAGETAITSALQVPHKRAANDLMLAAAERMVKTLRPHKDLLAEPGSKVKRVSALHLEIRRLRELVKTTAGVVADRAVPTRRIAELFAAGRRDVQALDALVAASPNKSSLLTWKHSSKIGRRIGRPKKRVTRNTRAKEAAA